MVGTISTILSRVKFHFIFSKFYAYLVGGFNPSEKYESQLGLLFPIYGKKMFQTTNQLFIASKPKQMQPCPAAPID